MYCSPNKRVKSGTTVCPNGTELAGQAPVTFEEAARLWPESFGGVDTEPPAPEVTSRRPPWNADTDPVRIMGTAATADRLSVNPQGAPQQEVITSVYNAKGYLNRLRGDDPDAYNDLVEDLRRYTGSKLGTRGSVETAWNGALKDAKLSDSNVMDLIRGGGASDGSGGRGGGAYTGPRQSITLMAESDINATANALALEMIGRPLNDKELDRVTRRIRGAEMAQPQVTTGDVKRTVTQQGLTAQGREDILREVIASRPEFESYQLDTTVMDAMNSYIQEKRAVIDV